MSNQEFSGVEQQLIRRAAATPITVPIFPMDELELVAVTRQACFHRERPPTRPRSCQRERRERFVVNLIRHQLAEFDRDLEHQLLRRGLMQGALMLQQRLLLAIESAYPKLSDEVHRQKFDRERRWGDPAATGRG